MAGYLHKIPRVHPEASKYCVESDTKLSLDVTPGELKMYKCKNSMWDIVTPVILDGQHVGYVFSGQFFFDDEPLNYDFFRSQARKYDFNEEEYIAALNKVPRLSREAVNTSMTFLMTFANTLSQLSYSNFKLAQSLAELDVLVNALQESEERFHTMVNAIPQLSWVAIQMDISTGITSAGTLPPEPRRSRWKVGAGRLFTTQRCCQKYWSIGRLRLLRGKCLIWSFLCAVPMVFSARFSRVFYP